jgi:hypothetical protein
LTLLKAGAKVTIISKFWPGDKDIEYTSPWYITASDYWQILYLLKAGPVQYVIFKGFPFSIETYMRN